MQKRIIRKHEIRKVHTIIKNNQELKMHDDLSQNLGLLQSKIDKMGRNENVPSGTSEDEESSMTSNLSSIASEKSHSSEENKH